MPGLIGRNGPPGPSLEGPGGVIRRSLTFSALAELLRRRWVVAIGIGPAAPYGPGDWLRFPGRGPGERGRGAWLNPPGLIGRLGPIRPGGPIPRGPGLMRPLAPDGDIGRRGPPAADIGRWPAGDIGRPRGPPAGDIGRGGPPAEDIGRPIGPPAGDIGRPMAGELRPLLVPPGPRAY
jgi:hypothetical protein